MSLTFQNFPLEVTHLIFEKLELNDIRNSLSVCKAWKRITESVFSLHIIDTQSDLIIDKNISVLGVLLIRAKSISSKLKVCLTAKKVIFVAERINWLGPIRSLSFNSYNSVSYILGPMPGGPSYSFSQTAKPDFWSTLVNSHCKNQRLIFKG